MTTRQNILARIKTIIQGIPEIKYVEVEKGSIIDITRQAFPACFISAGRETRIESGDEAIIGKENWTWSITIECIALYADMEELLGKIHTAMYMDYTIGNYAVLSYRTGVDILDWNTEKSMQSMPIEYEILYRHDLGQP